jgi:hypothetical protein
MPRALSSLIRSAIWTNPSLNFVGSAPANIKSLQLVEPTRKFVWRQLPYNGNEALRTIQGAPDFLLYVR